jgi:DNA-directed RNA polymerase subunit M/transcription elongation factor TFIIS
VENKLLAGEKSPFAKNSPASENQCPKCNGLLRPTDDGLKCWNCGYVKEVKESLVIEDQESTFSAWEKNQIVDALQEQYMRARGNVRRSKLESSKELLTIRADKLAALMKKVREF